MKYFPLSLRLLLSLSLLAGLFLQGCVEDRCEQELTFRQYTPVYMSYEAFLNAVAVESPRAMEEPGKIFVKDGFLFVNEIAQGIHIFDNSNPAAPVPLAFLRVPGNYDLQASCDKLYLDSSTDLLVFDITQPATPKLISRVSHALPNITTYRGYTADPNEGVVVEWREELVTRAFDCGAGVPHYVLLNELMPQEEVPADLANGNSRTVNPGTAGKAGSMSRFTVLSDYMYVAEPTALRVFNLNNCSVPAEVNTLDLSNLNFGMGEAEMITTLNSNLLIGATGGMFILDASSPESPEIIGQFFHADACDPVAAEGDIAYVTLRSGVENVCGNNFTNQLDVVSLENPSAPMLLNSYGMTNPHGVGIDKGTLFVADGESGLRVYDASDPYSITANPLAHFPEMFAYDVIPYNGVLILVGEDGLAQYDYSNPQAISLLSTLLVE